MDKTTCENCKKDVTPNNGVCPDCGRVLVQTVATVPQEPDVLKAKSLNVSYAKSLGIALLDDQLVRTLAAKFVAPDRIFHYTFLWGDEKCTDLECEFFTKSTNLWDGILGHTPRPLTWDHAMDESMKSSPIIGKTVEWGDDEIGRWAISHLDKAHQYRKAIDALIEEGVIGTSSDSAPQYVERVPQGKSAWLKTWPWFASALTDQPCEHRMVGTVEQFKSMGMSFQLPEAPDSQVRAMVQRAHLIFDHIKIFGE